MCPCLCVGKKWSDKVESNSGDSEKIPIVYSIKYNVQFCGLQKLHPFDARKGYHILKLLKSAELIDNCYATPTSKISTADLLNFHTKRYIRSLKWSLNVAKIAEIPLLVFVPNPLIQRGYLRPMRYQTAGSIMAGKLALRNGWAINLGGGFHHCSSDKGGGFCPYADISLLVKSILDENENGINKVMIVDLDAHQGNGHERDFQNDLSVFILDVYNSRIYPKDTKAKLAIRRKVELAPFTEDQEYLHKVKYNLTSSLEEFHPDYIVYNAGTDILVGDPLGLLSISPEGVIKRDEIVFNAAIERNIPIVMLLSGGYLRSSAQVIANSIINLNGKGLLNIRV